MKANSGSKSSGKKAGEREKDKVVTVTTFTMRSQCPAHSRHPMKKHTFAT